jgi:hypothetical protein
MVLASLSLSQPEYQERVIYYGESDNVCIHGELSDQIRLFVRLDGMETFEYYVRGFTGCNAWLWPYFNAIMPCRRF